MDSFPILISRKLYLMRAKRQARGFTLVEMVVVLAIIVIITTIALLGQSTFNQSLILTDTAYTVAFSVRQAQSLGLSSQRFGGVTQNAGYGIHLANGVTTSYLLFVDSDPSAPGSTQGGSCPGHALTTVPDAKPGDCLYSASDGLAQRYTFNRGFTLASFCGVPLAGGAQLCSGSGGSALDSLDITFLRPNTQATVIGVRGSTLIPLASASIHVQTPSGTTERCVSVNTVGQIAVGACP